MILDPYQVRFNSDIRAAQHAGYKNILAQLETGGGKTVIFSQYVKDFITEYQKDVIIFVDSESIFKQTRKTLARFGIDSDTINAKSAQIGTNTLFGTPKAIVSMVETFDRRASRQTFLNQLRNVGLVIVDECHMGNFIKIFEHFPDCIRIGFSATPESSNKKEPLCKYYETIVCGPSTEELIQINERNPARGIVRVVTAAWKNGITRKDIDDEESKLGYKGEDINQDLVGQKLRTPKQIQNTIDAILKHAPGMKGLVFNANIKHSIDVTFELCKNHFNARHIDSNCGQDYKDEIFGTQPGTGWLAKTRNAILCNVGITTKGFDEPSVEFVVLNTMTKSRTKFRQMCGRSARPYQYPDGSWKRWHINIDMCDNVRGCKHGEWSDHIDWEFVFKNPKVPKAGVAPSKECPECGYICPASARVCRGLIEDVWTEGRLMLCGHEFEITKAIEVPQEGDTVYITKNVDVAKIVNFPRFIGRPVWFRFSEVIRSVAYNLSEHRNDKVIDRVERL